MKSAILVVTVFLAAILIPSRVAHADVAPPSQPSGSNVVPGETTMVQMVSERVVVDLRAPWAEGNNADVTARFVMRNQGTVDEQMTVGFPLNNILNLNWEGTAPRLEDLMVKVNGQTTPVRYTRETDWLADTDQGEPILDWAVMDITFPAGEDVIIEVNYKQPPTYDAPTTQYNYTLFTGAGWYGPIGEGEIIFRLPYTVSWGENFWTYEDENIWNGLDTETVVENEVRWHFKDFEPQDYIQDNWTVHVIRPWDWQRVLAARQAVITNQYDARLWKELGDAYRNAAVELGGKTADSSYHAILAYQQSVTLQPDWAEAHALLAVEYYKAYANALFYASEDHPPDENLRQGALQELSVALALDPNNQTALDLKEETEFMWPGSTLPAPTPFKTPTLGPEETASSTVMPVTLTATRMGSKKALETTPSPRAAGTPTPQAATNTLMPTIISSEEKETGNQSPLSIAIIGMVATFIAGMVVASVWFKLTKK